MTTLLHGDCREVMAGLESGSVSAVVTDPPYMLEFMGKEWDAPGHMPGHMQAMFKRVPGAVKSEGYRQGIGRGPEIQAWHESWAREAYRVLKPGGHLLAFGGTRTFHRLTCAIEDAGFEIRDCVSWNYGSGFPKSSNPYRSIMSRLCQSHANANHAVRILPSIQAPYDAAKGGSVLELALIQPGDVPVLLIRTGEAGDSSVAMAISLSALQMVGMNLNIETSWGANWAEAWKQESTSITETVTRATTDQRILNCLQSLGTPPSITPDVWRPAGCSCAVVPVAESSSDGGWKWSATPLLIAPGSVTSPLNGLEGTGTSLKPAWEPIILARKPLIGTVARNVSEHGTGALNIDGCRIESGERPVMVRTNTVVAANAMSGQSTGATGSGEMTTLGRWPANVVLDEDAAAMLDAQSGERKSGAPGKHRLCINTGTAYGAESRKPGDDMTGYGDSGGASRFFYCAKASKRERNSGLGGPGGVHANMHPTVKPIALMRWLVRLVTPPGGIVLDPFMGSGTTGIACVLEGFQFTGIEQDAEYLEIAQRRIDHWTPKEPDLGPLFASLVGSS